VSTADAGAGQASAVTELDLRGEVCPYTFLKSKLALEGVPAGGTLRVLVDNETSARDVPRSLGRSGHAVLAVEPIGDGAWAIVVQKGSGGT
jgi:TusA-related sulfurtransferase